MADKITLEEALELVTFKQDADGSWHVNDVKGDVYGNIEGDIQGSVWGFVWAWEATDD